MSIETIPFITGSSSSGINSIVNQINAMIDQINSGIVNPGTNNASNTNALINWSSSVVNWASSVVSMSANLIATFVNIFGDGGSSTTFAHPGLSSAIGGIGGSGAGSAQGFSFINHIGGPSAGSTIPWSPIGATAPLNLTMADMTSIMSGIAVRRQSLLNTRETKRAAINALTTIAAVIVYDVTAGW
jgi:hypothetical protein